MALNDDATFRLVLIAGIAATFPIAIYYRIKSQTTGESLDRRQEGLFIMIALRLSGIAAWIGLIAFMIRPASMAWSSMPLPIALRWLGTGLGAAGAALLLWTFRTLGSNLTDTVVTRKAHTLVTNGPYRWVRHPFYDSAALVMVAVTLMTANWFFVAAGLLFLGLLIVRTKKEEENLLARFGDAYREYMNQTGRFLPKLT
jgi:protein-S-isoprenylcysteine O-methyltransferase Ste14